MLRNLIKEPLSVEELKKIATKIDDPKELVAPKRRAEAARLSGESLYKWLAADGSRVRRPIAIVAGKVTLGFAGDARAALAKLI